jgi:flagellar biogenesis protein FliO
VNAAQVHLALNHLPIGLVIVSEKAIHDHEEAAELSLIFIEILGAVVLAAWLFERFKRPTPSPIWFGRAHPS